jgi:hypothetical protein
MSTGTVNHAHSAQLDHETYADVVEATRTAILDYIGEHGLCIETWRAEHVVARQFGHDGYYHPGAKFAGQVKRALNQLAADGVLVKVGRGEQYPSGSTAWVHPAYFTPESFAEAERRATESQDAEDAEQARWDRVSAILTAQGFEHTPGSVGEGSVLIAATLEAWEALAARLDAP